MSEDPYYRSRYTWDDDRQKVWQEIVRFLNPYLSGADTIVDLGAGYCDFINAARAAHKIAVDQSPDVKAYAAEGVRVITGPVTDLSGIPDAAVDVVFASNLLEHLSDDELDALMKEVRRVLVPRGRFIAMQPNFRYAFRTYFDDPTHKKVFSHESLRSFLETQSFRIEAEKPKFLPFSFRSRPSLMPVLRLLVRTYLYSPWKPWAGQMLFVARKA